MCDSTDRLDADQDPQGSEEPRTVRFLVDGTAGRLVKWLRLLGFDSTYADRAADFHLVHRARSEGRVLLTRRASAAALPWAEAVHLESDSVDEQLVQVAALFPPPDHPMTRCSLCNALLESAPKEAVRDEVPPYVYATASGFSKCPECGHVYWQGTHFPKIMSRWKSLRKLSGSG
jgi:hypothetical protein